MIAIRQLQTVIGHNLTIELPDEFESKQVEIIVRPVLSDRQKRLTRLKNLFRKTQALPQVKRISEADIIKEIEAYRSGK